MPLVYVANHTYSQQHRYLGKPIYRGLMGLEARGYGLADMIVAISGSTASSLVEDYGVPEERITVIPVGVDTRTFRPGGLERIPGSVLYAGRLCERKGIPLLLHAMREVSRQVPGARLYVLGEGELRADLEETALGLGMSGSVKFLGRVGEAELVDWYNRVEVLALPSLFEGFGIVCMEAMSCATPVVATRVPGIADIIDDGENGLLVRRDIGELADAIRRLLADPGKARALGERGRSKARADFDWSKIAGDFAALYDRLLGGSPGPPTGRNRAERDRVAGPSCREELVEDRRRLCELLRESRYRKVMIVTTRLGPYPDDVTVLRGGIDSDTADLIEVLEGGGFSVTVAALDYMRKVTGSGATAVDRIGIYRPYSLEPNALLRTMRLLYRETLNPAVLARLLLLLRGRRPDVVILQESLQLGLAPHIAARLMRIPLYIRNDWICPARPEETACGFWKRARECPRCLRDKMGRELGGAQGSGMACFSAFIYLLKSWFWRTGAGAIPSSDFMAGLLADYGVDRGRITVVRPSRRIKPHPVSDEPFDSLKRDGMPKLLFVGRLEKDKGIDVLIDAFEMEVSRGLEAELLVAGEGTMHARVEQAAARCPRVIFLGWLDDRLLSQAYQVCDAVVMPTIVVESHGIVAEEAISYGKVLAGANRGGLAGIMREYERSVPIDRVDIDSLARVIRSLVEGAGR